jgi:hypothetical protein
MTSDIGATSYLALKMFMNLTGVVFLDCVSS